MAAKRTFGWVQNPGDLRKLKKVTGIFLPGSAVYRWLRQERLPLLLEYGLIGRADYERFLLELSHPEVEIGYGLLKGKGPGSGGRKDALCTGIIQAALDGQRTQAYLSPSGNMVMMKKPYTDDWSADGYLRWAISCGLLEYDSGKDTCKITTLGRALAVSADDSKEEKEALTLALLAYPPVIRILSLLKEQDEQTKFELGSRLGFVGELGFTSIPQNMYVYDFDRAPADEKSRVRANEEGDSDKYARGIASWLIQMGWAETSTRLVKDAYRGHRCEAELQTYTITREGEKALVRAKGNSSNRRLPRVVMFEMLASNKTPGADYIRYQRACLLHALSSTEKSPEQLQKALKGKELELSTEAIKDHVAGLTAIGIDIQERNGKYKLLDKIMRLEIPARAACVKEDVNDLKERVRERLKLVDHKYLILIDLAYSDASSRTRKNADAREFEIQTADLLTKELAFHGMRLGDSNRPDVIISYGTNGTIIDNKSYKDGFNIDRKCADEIGRYISENEQRLPGVPANEWWKEFDAGAKDFTFLFITSYLKGRFEDQLDYISVTHSGIKGAAIGVDNLLYMAEEIKSGRLTYEEFYESFENREMIFPRV